MTDMGDDFRAHRQYVRERKSVRGDSWARALPGIRAELRELGWSVSDCGPDGAWEFDKDGTTVTWWPSSGKTNLGEYFGKWPELKAHLVAIGDQ